ncbi:MULTISPECIES: hypothetical protein [unclassified Rhizobium]|uniref:hypothetical protein n=1 Tax=unclassified Rhizobium TaxID=2613769 RepID=UPI0038243DB1
MSGHIKNSVTKEKTAEGWVVTVVENFGQAHRTVFTDKQEAIEYENQQKRRLGF